MSRKDKRTKSVLRQAKKSWAVHPPLRGQSRLPFDEETRARLRNIARQASPTAAETQISDLIARVEAFLGDAGAWPLEIADVADKKRAAFAKARKALDRAMDALTEVASDPELKRAVNNKFVLLNIGIARREKRRTSANILEKDYFRDGEMRAKLFLYCLSTAFSQLIEDLDGAQSTPKMIGARVALSLANIWWTTLNTPPTHRHSESKDPDSPFQQFVKALPINIRISDNTVRGAVEFAQAEVEWAKEVQGGRKFRPTPREKAPVTK